MHNSQNPARTSLSAISAVSQMERRLSKLPQLSTVPRLFMSTNFTGALSKGLDQIGTVCGQSRALKSQLEALFVLNSRLRFELLSHYSVVQFLRQPSRRSLLLNRADRKSQVRQCLGFSAAYFGPCWSKNQLKRKPNIA